MNKYSVKLEIITEIEAFDEDDARDYISDIFGIDEEIKAVNMIQIKRVGKK